MCAKVRNKTDISKFVVQSLIIVLRRGISREMTGERPPKHSASGAVFFNVSCLMFRSALPLLPLDLWSLATEGTQERPQAD